MVALLTKLKWRLWKGGYQQDRVRIIGLVFGLLGALSALGGLAIGLPVLSWIEPQVAMSALVVLGAVALLLWMVIPIASFGLDDTLAANKFAQFPVRAKKLQPGLFAAAFVSVPVLCTVIGVLIMIVAGIVAIHRSGGGVLAMVITPLAFLAGLALCVLLPRALVTATSVGGVSRRRREVGGVVFVVLMLLVIYGTQIFISAESERISRMNFGEAAERVGLIAGWTPLGAPFAIPFRLATGNYLGALGAVVLTVATLVAVWLWWRHSLERTLVTGVVDQGGGTAQRLTGSFIPRIYPTTTVGAVAARSLRYWFRDKRYLTGAVITPIVGVVMIALSIIQNQPFTAFLAPVLAAWGAMALSDDFGYDGPAGWVNITAGLDARANLAGRGIAALTLFGPVAVVFGVAASLVAGRPDLIWPVVGGALGILGTQLGISAMLSAALPYPIKAPGASSFSSGSGAGVNAFLSAFAAMLGLYIPLIPAATAYVLGIVVWPWMLQLAPLVALATGFVMLRVGWHFGAKILAKREPEVFAKVRSWAK
ncbi:hypothetical protein [Enemella sp. A6]|uniref:hypothetical protein n=1 Tax=Enemella sp. A6 TaxID=3440152 RepID=UPI003EBA4652